MGKIITLEFKKDITVSISGEFKSDKEMQKEIERKVIELLQTKFPAYSYSVNNAGALTFENVKVGMVVKDNQRNKYGVVIKINKKTINVAFENGVLQGHPLAFSKVSDNDVKVKDIMWERQAIDKKLNHWGEGNVGHLVANDKIEQVVLLQSGKNYKGIIINNTYSYSLTENHLKALMFDTKKEAKDKLKDK